MDEQTIQLLRDAALGLKSTAEPIFRNLLVYTQLILAFRLGLALLCLGSAYFIGKSLYLRFNEASVEDEFPLILGVVTCFAVGLFSTLYLCGEGPSLVLGIFYPTEYLFARLLGM